MKRGRTILAVAGILAIAIAYPMAGGQDDNGKAPDNVLIEFGSPHPQPAPAQLSHVLVPDEATIRRRGTVTLRVNSGGHGIAIYPVSKTTTREEVAAQLCPHDATGICTDPTFANGDHTIVDGKGNVVIVSGTNPPFARLDDPTDRLLGTATIIDAVPGNFHTGTAAAGGAGTFMRFRFLETGRYLIICMNRAHSMNDWMFGFINVVGEGDDGGGQGQN